jgi:hypothetical protein
MICPPFAGYHRAKLERLVQEGFERIEREAAKPSTTRFATDLPMPIAEFQVLVAADAYLRSTKKKSAPRPSNNGLTSV